MSWWGRLGLFSNWQTREHVERRKAAIAEWDRRMAEHRKEWEELKERVIAEKMRQIEAIRVSRDEQI